MIANLVSRHLWSVVLLTASLPAGAANLIPNAGFDEPDLSGWTRGSGNAIEWSERDEAGSAASGSMRYRAFEYPLNPVTFCVPVVAGNTYTFGGSALIPSPATPSYGIIVEVLWWIGADCDNNSLYFNNGDTHVLLRDSWGPLQGSATAPPVAQSASLHSEASGPLTVRGPEAFLDNVFFVEDETCVTTLNALCLNHERFLVTVEWETLQGASGYGRAIRMTEDSGYFWFFNPENVEIVAKLIDACPTQFNTFWIFAAGLTDVETTLRVRDSMVHSATSTTYVSTRTHK